MSDKIFSFQAWDTLLSSTIEEIKKLASLKGAEYAGDQDRLANFRRNAQTLDISMELCWAIYYNKHHDAVMQFIKDKNQGKKRERAEPIQGRIDDMITYLILFKAILSEQDVSNSQLEKYISQQNSSSYATIFPGENRSSLNNALLKAK